MAHHRGEEEHDADPLPRAPRGEEHPWFCVVCGRDYDTVVRWRQRSGRRALQLRWITCGRPRCRRAHENSRRDERLCYYRERYERAKRHRSRPEARVGPWRCAVCGVGVEQALASRQRRGVRVFHTNRFRTCGAPKCVRTWCLRYSRAPVGPRKVIYVARRGTYRLARCERWPSGRSLLLLEAWPMR